MQRSIIFTFALFFLTTALPLSAQVSIAPSTVFIGDQDNIGTVYVSNRPDDAREVSIDFAFGYPASDKDGNLIMNYEDPVAFGRHAINKWVRAVPRSLVPGSVVKEEVNVTLE